VATSIGITKQWLDALESYVNGLQAEATHRSEQAVSFLKDTVTDHARRTPEWSELADDISVWSQDGTLYIGLQDDLFVSQAWALEYGDEIRPPNPFFRNLGADFHMANEYMAESARQTYGPLNVKPPK
jgi:hypothetical protein